MTLLYGVEEQDGVSVSMRRTSNNAYICDSFTLLQAKSAFNATNSIAPCSETTKERFFYTVSPGQNHEISDQDSNFIGSTTATT